MRNPNEWWRVGAVVNDQTRKAWFFQVDSGDVLLFWQWQKYPADGAAVGPLLGACGYRRRAPDFGEVGRKKINIEEIKDERARQVCFGKRKLGLMKKALELSILCRCEIGIIVFGANGNLHQWSSPRTSMKDLLQRYSEASSQTDPQQGGKEVLDVPSDLGSDVEDGDDFEEDGDVKHGHKRKREHGDPGRPRISSLPDAGEGVLALPRVQRSSSPVSEEGKAPSSLDLRLNAAARQCAALTPRSEKALSCISQEFDNIFSQLTSASESGTPAQTQGSPERRMEGPGASPVTSCAAGYSERESIQQTSGSPQCQAIGSLFKAAKQEPKTAHVSAWAAGSNAEARMTALVPHAVSLLPQHVSHGASVTDWSAPEQSPVPFAPSTTSAFTFPVRPVASAPLPTAVYEHLGGPPASSALRHSTASAFTPASAVMLGSRAPLGPSLQMAVVPVAVPAVPSGGVMVTPWPLSHPQPLRPSADQLQIYMRGATAPGPSLPPGIMATATPVLPGPVYMPHTAAVDGQPVPMQLAMGLS